MALVHMDDAVNLPRGIAHAAIDGIVSPYARQAHHVFEVPTREHVHAGQGGQCDVESVGFAGTTDRAGLDIGVGQLLCLVGDRQCLPVLVGHFLEHPAYLVRGAGEFLECEIRENQRRSPGPESLEYPP